MDDRGRATATSPVVLGGEDVDVEEGGLGRVGDGGSAGEPSPPLVMVGAEGTLPARSSEDRTRDGMVARK